MSHASGPPRRFRRRLLVLLLAAGLAPLAAWGLLSSAVVQQGLSLSPPLGPLLERASSELERGGDRKLVDELGQARLNLAQAELARRALLRQVPGYLAAAVALSALFLAAAAWFLGRSLARPIEGLTEGMVRFERGELGHQIPERSTAGDELDLAIRQFNRMGRELEAQRARLRVTEQLAAWQGVARSLAHELKNPLTAMKMALGRLRRPERSEQATAEAIGLIEEEIDVLLRMTRSFSEFARLPAPVSRPLDLGALVEEVCGVYRAQAPGIPVVVRARPLTVHADADQLRRALGNLVKNALEASRPGDGPVEVDVEGPDGEARVTVSDAGVGIASPLEGEALTGALGSTKADGSGLGLPIAHKIVHDHGGRLRLEPRAPRGTRAIVWLPRGETA